MCPAALLKQPTPVGLQELLLGWPMAMLPPPGSKKQLMARSKKGVRMRQQGRHQNSTAERSTARKRKPQEQRWHTTWAAAAMRQNPQPIPRGATGKQLKVSRRHLLRQHLQRRLSLPTGFLLAATHLIQLQLAHLLHQLLLMQRSCRLISRRLSMGWSCQAPERQALRMELR